MSVSFSFPFRPMPVNVGVVREEQDSDIIFRGFPKRCDPLSDTRTACKFIQLQR